MKPVSFYVYLYICELTCREYRLNGTHNREKKNTLRRRKCCLSLFTDVDCQGLILKVPKK